MGAGERIIFVLTNRSTYPQAPDTPKSRSFPDYAISIVVARRIFPVPLQAPLAAAPWRFGAHAGCCCHPSCCQTEQFHAMRTLHLMTVPYPLRSLPEHLRAAKAFDLDLLVYHGGAPK